MHIFHSLANQNAQAVDFLVRRFEQQFVWESRKSQMTTRRLHVGWTSVNAPPENPCAHFFVHPLKMSHHPVIRCGARFVPIAL